MNEMTLPSRRDLKFDLRLSEAERAPLGHGCFPQYYVYTCQELEDEYHFILICKKDNLLELRRRYIKSYYFVNPSMFKLTQLLTSENRKTIRNLAIYVYKGLYKLEWS